MNTATTVLVSAQGAGYRQYVRGEWEESCHELPEEAALSLFVNGRELVTIMCTPHKLNCLVVGFLRSEGLIRSTADIEVMRICPDDAVAEVRLKQQLIPLPEKRILTSGCGGGTSFEPGSSLAPLDSGFRTTPETVLCAMQKLLQEGNGAGGRHRGMHMSALTDGNGLLVAAEDIGRHNTVDKIWGECTLRGIETADCLLVTTGRISSEMLIKAARMSIPLVASLNSATRRAVELGARLGISIIGYARGGRCSVFCGAERLQTGG